MKPEIVSVPDWELLKAKYPNNLEEIVNKINAGYPVQYLIGNVAFLNTVIDVDENVLIPRFETEGLVDKTIKYAQKLFSGPIKIIDLGTGSGCIAIALKKNLDCEVTALDISENALKLAQNNALKNNQKIKFIKKDMLKPFKEKYDILISNPPYISPKGYVSEQVLKYEPHLALFAKCNGLYYYKKILKKHLKQINKPGLIAFEIGDNATEGLTQILTDLGIKNYLFEKDLAKMERYLFIFNE